MRAIKLSALSRAWAYRVMALSLAASLAACGGGTPSETSSVQSKTAALTTTAASDMAVTGLSLVKEIRVSRTVFDYEFRVTLKNNGTTTQTGVSATLSAVGAGATIVDGAVQIGTIGAGASVTPQDTITIRQDRSFPFNQGALQWNILADSGPSAVPGILLPGAPTANAVSVLQDYDASLSASDLDMELSNGEPTNYRLQLSGVIAPGASVAAVNAALQSIGARIVGSFEGSPVVFVQIPPPGGFAALSNAAAALVASGAFEAAAPEIVEEELALPPGVSASAAVKPSTSAVYSPVVHHLAAGFPHAWNAIGASAPGNVGLIIVDNFGNGALPNSLLSGAASGMTTGFSNGCRTTPCTHGYHVLGIAAANFGGAGTLGQITGAMPLNSPIHIVDTAQPVSTVKAKFYMGEIRRILEAAPSDKRFVLNFSFGYSKQMIAKGIPAAVIQADALRWRKFVASLRGFDYATRAIQVSAAGNSGPQTSAQNMSMFNAAALLPAIVVRSNTYQPLKNALVVENRQADFSNPDLPVPGCLSPTSSAGGNIGAIGTSVRSFVSPSATEVKSGTSMASPQVAGLVATMMKIRSDLDTSSIVDRLTLTAMLPDSCTNAALMIHAGDALLSLDRTLTDAPVRLAMLQASGVSKPQFDDADTQLLLDALFPATPISPTTKPDFSRYDLNGDGYTGGNFRRRPYDLKFASSLANYSLVEVIDRYPTGAPIKSLDEAGLTDFEILCYYVNSPMFNSARRTQFETQLATISQRVGKTVSCSSPGAIELTVGGTPSGDWVLPGAPIRLTPINQVGLTFYLGSNMNTVACQQGERGGPIWSGTVEPGARYFTVNAATNVPYSPSAGGPPNRLGCSSFYASRAVTGGNKLWATASSRVQGGFGSAIYDREFQVRYYSGDPGNNNAGAMCQVGYVPNPFGPFVFQFGATCSHNTVFAIVE